MNMTERLEEDNEPDMKNLDLAVEGIKSLKGKSWATQAHLSELSGVSQPQISRLLVRKGTIGFDLACKILDALGAQIFFPGSKLATVTSQTQPLSPFVSRAQEITRTLKDAGVAELEILRAIRSMIDTEIERVARSYQTGEDTAEYGTAAEAKADYGKETKRVRKLRLDDDDPAK